MKEWQKFTIDAIDTKIKDNLSDLKFDKSYRGVITRVEDDAVYVLINEEEYVCKVPKGLVVNVGDVVIIDSINNNFSDLYIDKILKGTGGYNTVPIYTSSYTHIQITPSREWTITHNLNKYPNVTIVDSSSTAVMGDIIYISENQIKAVFSSPFAGKAFLN